MSSQNTVAAWVVALLASVAVGGWMSAQAEEGQFGTPKGTEGTRIFKATEHLFYTVESRHCMGCGEKDREEHPHLRCRCGAQFWDHCIQAHCCSGIEASPRTPPRLVLAFPFPSSPKARTVSSPWPTQEVRTIRERIVAITLRFAYDRQPFVTLSLGTHKGQPISKPTRRTRKPPKIRLLCETSRPQEPLSQNPTSSPRTRAEVRIASGK
jgi:hypothetical protein